MLLNKNPLVKTLLLFSVFVLMAPSLPQKVHGVVELFTSQGCNTCPGADRSLRQIADTYAENSLLNIGWHVDYWDYLGWKDVFASRENSNRQRLYARALGSSVYTPQLVFNGDTVILRAWDWRAVSGQMDRILASTPQGLKDFAVRIIDAPTQGKSGEVDVFIPDLESSEHFLGVLVLESQLYTKITRGENHGKTLRYDSVVRSQNWTRVYNRQKIRFKLPKDVKLENATLAVLVQNDQFHSIRAVSIKL